MMPFLSVSLRFIPYLLLTLLLLGCSNSQLQPQNEADTQLIVSPLDRQDYRGLTLDNGLKVLLIHDPQADKAAASLNVAAGSLHEPDAWPGLAHFLEHMLFLGTETFPAADDYQNFIRQQGGSYNAFTAPRDTNYFFDIRPDHLEGALTRFSRFFIDPLLDETYLQREVNAVHAEWRGTLQDDGRLQLEALRQTLNPQHPASRFSAGNRDTLDASNPLLRQALLNFYRNYYQPQKMTLAVYGPQSLDQLQQWVERLFSDIQPATETPAQQWPALIQPEHLPAQLQVRSLRHAYQMQLLFPVPDPALHERVKPDYYLASLLGHEGEGSLLHLLQQLGWANALSAGTQMQDGKQALFGIYMDLTPEGHQHRDEIRALAFAYLDLIRTHGIEAWRYQEAADLAHTAFIYAETGDPARQVTHLSMNLARYPLADALYAPYRLETFDAALIRQFLDHLTPARLLEISSSADAVTDQRATHLPAEYRLIRPFQPPLPDVSHLNRLHLPEPNPFANLDFSLKSGTSESHPQLLRQSEGWQIWQGLNTEFQQPKAQIYISLQNPQVATRLSDRLLARLMADWLNEQLNAPAYAAREAGLFYRIYPHTRGITLQLGGFNAGQQGLLDLLLQPLANPAVDPQLFARLQQRLAQHISNQQHDRLPQQMLRHLHQRWMQPSGWATATQLAQLEQLTAEDLQAFIQRFDHTLHVQMLAWGNITADETLTLADQLERVIQPGLDAEAVDLLAVRSLAPGWDEEQLQLLIQDQGLLLYLQGLDASLKEEALLRLLAQTQSAEFFHQLRTEQQLGYAVYSYYFPLLQRPGLIYFIQSPNHQTDELTEAVRNFLHADLQRIQQLSATDFAQHQHSVMAELQQQPRNLGEAAAEHWQTVTLDKADFERRQQLIEQISQLTQEEVVDFYQDLLAGKRGFYLLTSQPID